MVTFDDAISGAKKVFDTAAGKTGEALELSRLYVRKAQIKNRIQSLYTRLGKATYNTSRDVSDEENLINTLMEEVDRQIEILKKTEEKIQEASSFNCPACDKKNSPKAKACRFCGAIFSCENISPDEADSAVDAEFTEE